MSDLIRREDAIKLIKDSAVDIDADPYPHDCVCDLLEVIPTIDAVPKDFHDKTCKAMAKRHTEEIQKLMPKRGEWIKTGRTNIYGGIEVQCSNCGDKVMVQHLEDEWFCRHCGADMGMKGADNGTR